MAYTRLVVACTRLVVACRGLEVACTRLVVACTRLVVACTRLVVAVVRPRFDVTDEYISERKSTLLSFMQSSRTVLCLGYRLTKIQSLNRDGL